MNNRLTRWLDLFTKDASLRPRELRWNGINGWSKDGHSVSDEIAMLDINSTAYLWLVVRLGGDTVRATEIGNLTKGHDESNDALFASINDLMSITL